MKTLIKPERKNWNTLINRPIQKQENLFSLVNTVFTDIKKKGDKAVKFYSNKFDQSKRNKLIVSESEIKLAESQISNELKKSIQLAKRNIEIFHKNQVEKSKRIKTSNGVTCWRENRAIEKVGIYIPGGTAPLFSTVLMLAIPANIAGCNEIILCTPPDKNGKINPAILYTAKLCGVTKIFAVGGIQAIAAMTFGTKEIPQVYKIFGPGNQYVTAAKQQAQNFGVAIDMPAGPSELLIIADKTGNPEFIAADLLSQAEHGTDSQVILLSDSNEIIENTKKEISRQLKSLPRKSIADAALKNSKMILMNKLNDCIDYSNNYAPEHLILAMKYSENDLRKIQNAGSVFLGNYSCESAGDYASGTNHTLPTNGYARNYSGVSVDSFVKKITFQNVTKQGLEKIGPAIEIMAETENLMAHKNAVSVRLKRK